mmetsp:Transcript_18985/g.18125  ORF Transcript_18985/g.18125 Transcript_18985/m.18125 type:complete len:98 (+) Transcript_18985:917-1210(+)
MAKAQTGDQSPNAKQKTRPASSPSLYTCMFNKKQDLIFAGGAGSNEFRIFDFETGNIVCIVSDMERSIMCMDIAKKSSNLAFGSGDACLRILDVVAS